MILMGIDVCVRIRMLILVVFLEDKKLILFKKASICNMYMYVCTLYVHVCMHVKLKPFYFMYIHIELYPDRIQPSVHAF